MAKIFVIIAKFTKITKIFDHGNLELYGKLSLARIFSVHLCQNLIPCFHNFCSTIGSCSTTHHLNFKFFINLVCLLFIGHKDYNNNTGAHIYSKLYRRLGNNGFLEALVNNMHACVAKQL